MKEHEAADVDDPGWLMSALADGEAGAAELDRCCQLWAAEASVQRCWHDYHLIGDVLRSQDLASRPRHDQAFVRRLSARLDIEPAVLAPAPLGRAATPPRRRRAVPVALAASVMALGTAVAVWSNLDDPTTPAMLAATPAAATVPTLAALPAAAAPAAVAQTAAAADENVPTGTRLVRDAQLDRYLRAHRDYAAALPGSLPGGSARSMATVSFER